MLRGSTTSWPKMNPPAAARTAQTLTVAPRQLLERPQSGRQLEQYLPREVRRIIVVPTLLEALGLPIPEHRVEGRSLRPLLRAEAGAVTREFVVGSLDYAYREARTILGRGPHACTGWMVREERYKLIIWEGYAPQLFDLQDDPHELHDRASDPSLAPVERRLRDGLLFWMLQRRRRTSETGAQVRARTHAHERMMNILIGRW